VTPRKEAIIEGESTSSARVIAEARRWPGSRWFCTPAFPLCIGFGVAGLTLIPGVRGLLGLFFLRPDVRFAGLLLLVGLALALSSRPGVRVGFATAILALMVIGATRYGERLPFESWGLYTRPAASESTVYFLDIVSRDGSGHRLDGEVMGRFTTPTNHNRWARRIVEEMPEADRRAFACFLVERTRIYREERLHGGALARLVAAVRHPPHQYALRWGDPVLEAVADPVGIRIRIQQIRLNSERDWEPEVLSSRAVDVPCF
jgi:hypothetical protein